MARNLTIYISDMNSHNRKGRYHERPALADRRQRGFPKLRSGSATDVKEANHVPFVNHHFLASFGNYHHRYPKQYAFGFQIFSLEFSDILYHPDSLFSRDWCSNCGGSSLT
jgi:hypothetical protein